MAMHSFTCILNWVYSPIFAEIVPEKSRTSIYALDRSFESVLSSFAPPVVGVLAQHVYGYKPVSRGSSESAHLETDRENAKSLSRALYTAIGIPMLLCCFIYSFLHCTYPRDRDRARMHALIESEMLQMESSSSPLYERDSEFQISVAKDLDGDDDRAEIELSYGIEDSLDFNDNDEKYLLNHNLTVSDSK